MNHPRSTTPSGDPNPTNNPLLAPSNPLVSDLEQEVLDEYTRLLRNVNKLSSSLADLAGSPASLTLDGLRHLERKIATVYTSLKASVYSIVLQQHVYSNEEEHQHLQDVSRVGGDATGENDNTLRWIGRKKTWWKRPTICWCSSKLCQLEVQVEWMGWIALGCFRLKLNMRPDLRLWLELRLWLVPYI